MLKRLLNKGPTTKIDVAMACAAALVGVWKAFDTYRDYKQDHSEENEK